MQNTFLDRARGIPTTAKAAPLPRFQPAGYAGPPVAGSGGGTPTGAPPGMVPGIPGESLNALISTIGSTTGGIFTTVQTALNNASRERLAEIQGQTAEALARLQANAPTTAQQAAAQAQQQQILELIQAATAARLDPPPQPLVPVATQWITGYDNSTVAIAGIGTVAVLGALAYVLTQPATPVRAPAPAPRGNPVVAHLNGHARHFVSARKYRSMQKHGKAKGLRALPRYEG